MKQKFTLIELLAVTAQFLSNFAKKAITFFADAKNVITRTFLERIEGVRGRKGEPFFKKVSLSPPAPFTLIERITSKAENLPGGVSAVPPYAAAFEDTRW